MDLIDNSKKKKKIEVLKIWAGENLIINAAVDVGLVSSALNIVGFCNARGMLYSR